MKYLGYHNLVEKEGVFMAAPIGMVDSNKKNYWDATDACCDFAKTKPGDSSYLSKLIEEIKGSYKIDPKRVYLIGHSNGGYMSYRMACDHADQIAAIVSLAGATWSDTTKCVPKDKVSVLQIHGDKDSSVKYAGGSFGAGAITYPGAVKTAKIWATYNGCHAATTTSAKALDLDLMVAGAETQMMKHKGCPAGIGVELWTIKGGGHLPIPTPSFASETWAFFKAHPKP